MGYFSRAEFMNGLSKLGVADLDQLKKRLKPLEASVMSDQKSFDEVHLVACFTQRCAHGAQLYKFAFHFSKGDPNSKVLDTTSAADMLHLLMGKKPHGQSFVEWLRSNEHAYRAINFDQWYAPARLSVVHDTTVYELRHSDHLLVSLQISLRRTKSPDLWRRVCFLDFSRSINGDFSNYDENSAWPLLLDEYATAMRKV